MITQMKRSFYPFQRMTLNKENSPEKRDKTDFPGIFNNGSKVLRF